MTNKILFSFLFILVSCIDAREKDYGNYKIFNIDLINNIGTVTMELPLYYDTLYQWDCLDHTTFGDYRYYKLQSIQFPIIKNLCGSIIENDTFNSFIIRHKLYEEFYSNATNNPQEFVSWTKQKLLINNSDLILDTIFTEIINQNLFVIYNSTDQLQKWQECVGSTFFGDTPIEFVFRNRISNGSNIDFMNECIYLMKTIRLENNNR